MTEDVHTPTALPTPPPAVLPDAPRAEETPLSGLVEATPEPPPLPVEEPVAVAEVVTAPPVEAHEEPVAPTMIEEPEPAPEPEAVVEAPVESEAPPAEPEAEKSKKHWYVVKVQSGREDTIREAIERRVRKDGLEESFGQIVIPVEKVSEVKVDKNGKKVTRTKERRLYAGYLFVEVEYNDRILYLFRETSGVGGFVGEHPGQPERPPTPMAPKEIQRILGGALPDDDPAGKSDVPPPPKGLGVGDHVRVVDGPFNGMDATVKAIHADTAKVLAEVTIFGRPVEVDFEYYQIEQ